MSNSGFVITKDATWWVFTLPAFLGSKTLFDGCVLLSIALAVLSFGLLSWAFTTGGPAWKSGRNRKGPNPIPGPHGLPILGSLLTLSRGLAHRSLASMAWTRPDPARQLMALSIGSTPLVVTSDPHVAKELLTSPHLADRPLKLSAKCLMFGRAIGFAPNGSYWRLLRRIASTHLFSPRRITAHEAGRRLECSAMVRNVSGEAILNHGAVSLRGHLQAASLNDIMGSVFGRRYDVSFKKDQEDGGEELREMVREGFELLGSFNWSDHVPWLSWFYDPERVAERCAGLVPRVRRLVRGIIEEHRVVASEKKKKKQEKVDDDRHDFVDVLLSLEGDEKLSDDDMVAVLWEMIFRGTDTTALLTEWVMAELVLNPEVQTKLRAELKRSLGDKSEVAEAELANLPYLQAVVKETLRVHPPGPLLSWARLSTSDVHLSNGMVVPANTTAMVNMWAITHDPQVWPDPLTFRPERFVESEGGVDIDIRGSDLRLAPFGAGRRVCPGKNLGLVTVTRWVAELVRSFSLTEDPTRRVDLSEVLKLSCEMKYPLSVVVKKIRGF